MRPLALKSLTRSSVLLFVLALTSSSAWAQGRINVNQDTFVLSDEAPGHLITRLIDAGYGNSNLYQVLVAIRQNTNPSVAGLLTPAFMSTLANAPAGAEIFTTPLKDTLANGVSVSISTDGSARYDDIEASTYTGRYPTLQGNIPGVGNVDFVHSTDSQAPLNANVVQGPLAGMTTTYNAFAVAAGSATQPEAVPTLTGWGMAAFALLIGASGTYCLTGRGR